MALFNDVLLLLMVVPMLPSLLQASTVGAGSAHREFSLALLFSAKEFCQCICAPFAGALTVHVGARVSLTASLVGLAISTVAFAEARTFRQLVVARVVQGATSAALMSGGLTLIAQTHEPERRSRAIAQAHSGLGLGAALGPVLGGLGYDRLGKRGTFYCVATLIACTAVAHVVLHLAAPTGAHSWPATPEEQRLRERTPLARQLLDLLRVPPIATVLAGMLACYAAGGLFDATFGLHLADRFGIGPARASMIFSIEPAVYLVTMAGLGASTRFADRAGKAWLAAAGLALTGLSLPLLTLGCMRTSVVIALVLHGAGYSAKDAVGHGLLADLVEEHGVGSLPMAFALADSADSLGYIIGPLVGTALSGAFGGRTVGLLCFGLFCAALIGPTLRLRRTASATPAK
jgi:MFS family permease